MSSNRTTATLPRVVVTGTGSVSCAGVGNDALLSALRERRSGIRYMSQLADLGMRCHVGGPVDTHQLDDPDRKLRRFVPANTWYAWQATREALAQSQLGDAVLRSPRCGLVMGGGAALSEHEAALDSFRERGAHRLSPYIVPRGMSSALAAGLAHAFGIGGRSHVISAACTSGAHAIGQAMELIQLGKQDVVICGGNDDPERASRPYDLARDGIVLAAGAGVLVLESEAHAQARGARILGEIAGYGAATDAGNMVGPGIEGLAQAMHEALLGHDDAPEYINAHACSTPQGDRVEWEAMAKVFAGRRQAVPAFSSIKGLVGHAPGAAGAIDAIASLLMMRHGFLSAGSPVIHADPTFAEAPLLAANVERVTRSVLSNSFGFGGSCASLLLRAPSGADA